MHGKLELGQLSPPAEKSNPANSLTHDTRPPRQAPPVPPLPDLVGPSPSAGRQDRHNLAIHHAITHSHVDLAGEAFELSPQPHGSRSIRIAPVHPTVAARSARNFTLIWHPAIMARNVRADWMEPAAHGAGGPAPGACQTRATRQGDSGSITVTHGQSRLSHQERPFCSSRRIPCHRSSKLVMRVRFPSPAPTRQHGPAGRPAG